jgi:sensor histidine kinase YesM
MLQCIFTNATAQTMPLPEGFVFDPHKDLRQYTPLIIPCVNWLQQTPLGEHKNERAEVNNFVLNWLQINPDVNISMPDYSFTFNNIDKELLYLFMESWIKYTLQMKDQDITRCSVAGLNGMLDYYQQGKAARIGSSSYLDNLVKIRQAGKLPALFDTARNAINTYLYLDTPNHKITYQHDENYFHFNFYSINFVRPRAITYRYMLEGYYDKWIVTKEGSVTYPRLPSGSYNFRVQVSMFSDFSDPVERRYTFTIAKPIWTEPWFLAVGLLLCALLIYLIIKQREKNLENIALLKHQRIVFEYEHLKSQVNPHFLFNSFNTLANLIEKNQGEAIDYSERLSELYRSVLAHHDNDFVLLADEITVLKNYIAIQKGRFGESLQLQLNIPEHVIKTKKIVPLALQILIENVIKHNVISAQNPLVINIEANEEVIIIRNVIHPKMSKEKGEGLGLINIKRRYELLTKYPVSYGPRGNEFIVTLPLLVL